MENKMTLPIHGEPAPEDDYLEPFRWKTFEMQTAIRSRQCTKCRNTIFPGEECLRFKYGSSYYTITANLCRICMLTMLQNGV